MHETPKNYLVGVMWKSYTHYQPASKSLRILKQVGSHRTSNGALLGQTSIHEKVRLELHKILTYAKL
jgi:hypothetical protein